MRSEVRWKLCWENELELIDHVDPPELFRKAQGPTGVFNFSGSQSWARRADNLHWQATDADKGARGDEESAASRPFVHWTFRLRQVDNRQCARPAAACPREAHLHPRRRQRAPRAQSRPGFNQPDRVENIRRVAEVAELMEEGSLLKSSSTRRLRNARDAIRRGFIGRRSPARSPISPAFPRRTKSLRALNYTSKRLATTLRRWRLRSNSSSKGEWSK